MSEVVKKNKASVMLKWSLHHCHGLEKEMMQYGLQLGLTSLVARVRQLRLSLKASKRDDYSEPGGAEF